MSVQAIKAIDGIRFSVWSPTEIRKYSVAEITAPETYDEDGMPVQEASWMEDWALWSLDKNV